MVFTSPKNLKIEYLFILPILLFQLMVAKKLTKKDWSKVIWDQLKVSAETTMTRKRSGYKNHPRIVGLSPLQLHGCMNMSQVNPPHIFLDFFSESDYNSLINFYNNKEPNEPNNDNYYDENGGISTIIIETGESEE